MTTSSTAVRWRKGIGRDALSAGSVYGAATRAGPGSRQTHAQCHLHRNSANTSVLALAAGSPEAGDPAFDRLLLRLGGASAIRARATTDWWACEGRWCGSAMDLI